MMAMFEVGVISVSVFHVLSGLVVVITACTVGNKV